MAFSHDSKYAAYLYRPYSERSHGPDLWLVEVASGKVTRATTVEKMAKYQASARKVVGDRKNKPIAARAKGGPESGVTTGTGKGDSPADGDDEPKGPFYSGVDSFTWAPAAHELLFTSEGDVYRWKVGEDAPTRLTK